MAVVSKWREEMLPSLQPPQTCPLEAPHHPPQGEEGRIWEELEEEVGVCLGLVEGRIAPLSMCPERDGSREEGGVGSEDKERRRLRRRRGRIRDLEKRRRIHIEVFREASC